MSPLHSLPFAFPPFAFPNLGPSAQPTHVVFDVTSPAPSREQGSQNPVCVRRSTFVGSYRMPDSIGFPSEQAGLAGRPMAVRVRRLAAAMEFARRRRVELRERSTGARAISAGRLRSPVSRHSLHEQQTPHNRTGWQDLACGRSFRQLLGFVLVHLATRRGKDPDLLVKSSGITGDSHPFQSPKQVAVRGYRPRFIPRLLFPPPCGPPGCAAAGRPPTTAACTPSRHWMYGRCSP